jgi:hypothetical protein
MNLNYIKECTRIIGEHNKHENLIAIWDEPIKKFQPQRPNQMKIGLHLLIAMWFRSRPNIGA